MPDSAEPPSANPTVTAATGQPLWVFGYGSLMWRPGFPYEEVQHGFLSGVHRALCVYSHVHRGTPRLPGLVLGLDAGGWCEGIAYRVAPEHVHHTLNYLRRRELMNNTYRVMWRTVALRDEDRRKVRALCFVVNRNHRQYAGRLPLELQGWLVRRSIGKSGRNIDYVINTVRHLRERGIYDQRLEALVTKLGHHRRIGRDISSGDL
jgi:cation transport protein ChaC